MVSDKKISQIGLQIIVDQIFKRLDFYQINIFGISNKVKSNLISLYSWNINKKYNKVHVDAPNESKNSFFFIKRNFIVFFYSIPFDKAICCRT